jgi:SSS family solute:Na+ symporter
LDRVRIGVISSAVTVVAGILMAVWVSTHSSGIFQYVQTLNAFFAPPFAAAFLLGLLWRGANSTGALWAIVGGFLIALAIKIIGIAFTMPGWFYPFANQAGMVWTGSVCLCVAGSLLFRRSASDPGPVSLTIWHNAGILREGLGDKWYQSVPLWSAGFFILAMWIMALFAHVHLPRI